jgi:hypothetical protein
MSNTNKTTALLLTIIVAMSCLTLLTVKLANAQSPTPSVPEFSLKIVDYMAGGGLQIEIKNQPVIPNGHDTSGIFYDFRYKWHESASWYHPEPNPTEWKRQYISEIGTTGVTTMVGSPNSYYEKLGNTSSQELDLQIRAINGYQNTTFPFPPISIEPGDNPIIVVSASDWSPTQTITLPAYSVIPNQTSSPAPTSSITPVTPTQSPKESPTETPANGIPSTSFLLLTNAVALIVIVVLLAVIVALLLLMRHRKTAKVD